jgi:FecR protein
MRLRSLVYFALGSSLAPFVPYLAGQSVIATRSGLINFSEGLVFMDGQPLTKKFGSFERLKKGSELLTQSGRAEVLLTPNTYLRIGENSSIRMVSDDLADTKVEVLAGSAVLDSESAPAGDFVKLLFKDATIRILQPGRYRVDAEPAQLRVYEGQAEVTRDGRPATIEASQLFPLDGAPVVKRFTEGADGLLDIWADERHSMIASNMTDANTITDPLFDTGQVSSSDYLSYVGPYGGYIPLAAAPPIAGGYYGYGNLGYGPLAYAGFGYNPYIYSFMRPYPGLGLGRSAYSGIVSAYGVRTGSTISVFGSRPATGGTIALPRPVFAPRPSGSGIRVAPRIGGRR